MANRNQALNIASLFVPIVVALLLWWTGSHEQGLLPLFASVLVLTVCWGAFLRWMQGSSFDLPLFGVMCGLYWLYFMLPMFLGDDQVKLYGFMDLAMSREALDRSLQLVLVGLAFLWLGMATKFGRRLVPSTVLDLADSEKALAWTRALLLFGLFLNLFESAPTLFGPLRQLIILLQNTVPLTAFAILVRLWFKGKAVRQDKALVASYVIVRLIVGLASGWLGSVVGVLVVIGLVYVAERRRLPFGIALVFLMVFMFLQAGKEDFRRVYWRANIDAGRVDRMLAWIDSSWAAWGEAFADDRGDLLRERALTVLSRVSLLPQTANVMELTPEVVPHQGFRLYSYLAVTFIPRFVWTNKPSINEANRFYQVAYGLTTEENLDSVSISVGYLTEGYISWGWVGTALVMFLMGIFYDFFQGTFLNQRTGILAQAMGAALLFQLTAIESQVAQYLGGLVQQVLVVTVAFLPVLQFREVSREDPERTVPQREPFSFRQGAPLTTRPSQS